MKRWFEKGPISDCLKKFLFKLVMRYKRYFNWALRKIGYIESEKKYGNLFFDDIDDKNFYSAIYDDLLEDYEEIKREYVCGECVIREVERKDYYIKPDEDMVIPVKPLNDTINIIYNTKRLSRNLGTKGEENRFLYLKVKKGEELTICADKSVIVGKPLPLTQKNKHKKKMIIMLLIDSLAQVVLDKYGLENVMPNTADFFSEGIIMNNCYCGADWTFPGIATILTGRPSYKHRMVHPRGGRLNKGDIFTKFFKERNYLTSCFNSNWRMAPEYGYVQNMDRSVYITGSSRGTCAELINNAIEQMEAFNKRDQFIILSIMDLHHFMKNYPDISTQIKGGIENVFFQDDFKGKSVNQFFNPRKEKVYLNEIYHLDMTLKLLYEYLMEAYSKEQYTVILACDHGVSFVGEDDFPKHEGKKRLEEFAAFRESMFKVPIMIKDSRLKSAKNNYYTNNQKLYSLMKVLAYDEELSNDLVDKIFKQDYVYNESIYPGQTYKAKIVDDDCIFYFESKDLVTEDCYLENIDGISEIYMKNKKEFVDDIELEKEYMGIVKEHLDGLLKKMLYL